MLTGLFANVVAHVSRKMCLDPCSQAGASIIECVRSACWM